MLGRSTGRWGQIPAAREGSGELERNQGRLEGTGVWGGTQEGGKESEGVGRPSRRRKGIQGAGERSGVLGSDTARRNRGLGGRARAAREGSRALRGARAPGAGQGVRLGDNPRQEPQPPGPALPALPPTRGPAPWIFRAGAGGLATVPAAGGAAQDARAAPPPASAGPFRVRRGARQEGEITLSPPGGESPGGAPLRQPQRPRELPSSGTLDPSRPGSGDHQRGRALLSARPPSRERVNTV